MKKSVKKTKKIFEGSTTVDAAEVNQFNRLGAEWWDEQGPMKPLHRLNPLRISYIRDQTAAHFKIKSKSFDVLKGLRMADIGCGGGLVTEPLYRLGATVTGIDAGAKNIRIAQQHASQQELNIDYRATTAEDLAETGATFDVVTALEIVEHVANPELFIASCCKLVKKDGLLILSTLNRTPKSFALGIVAAEYILRWLPAGTHDWKKFMKPSEMARMLTAQGFETTNIKGLVYNPFSRDFSLSASDINVNYLMTAKRR